MVGMHRPRLAVGPCVTALLVLVTTGGCVGASPSARPSAAPTATGDRSTVEPTQAASTAPESHGPPVLPASGQAVEPGTYRWDGFQPALELTVGDGWKVGHRHGEYFDLFVGGGFPGVGFGRFDAVHVTDAVTRPMTDAASVVAAMKANPTMRVEDVGKAALAGLTGLTVDLRVTKERTAVLDGAGGTFHLDPGFTIRYHLLDVPGGGVLEVSVLAGEGRAIDDAAAVAAPILSGLRLAS